MSEVIPAAAHHGDNDSLLLTVQAVTKQGSRSERAGELCVVVMSSVCDGGSAWDEVHGQGHGLGQA